MTQAQNSTTESSSKPVTGRNEPCPCGSGKKYKRCCGVDAAPKLTQAKPTAGLGGAEGFDPQAMMNQMDPKMMNQMASMLQRLPKGQLQRMQAMMQKAMSGKDVSKEAADFEKTLPVEMQAMFKHMALSQMGGAVSETSGSEAEMTEEQARQMVAEAAAKGMISKEQAAQLLKESEKDSASAEAVIGEIKPGGFSKLWKNITGKK